MKFFSLKARPPPPATAGNPKCQLDLRPRTPSPSHFNHQPHPSVSWRQSMPVFFCMCLCTHEFSIVSCRLRTKTLVLIFTILLRYKRNTQTHVIYLKTMSENNVNKHWHPMQLYWKWTQIFVYFNVNKADIFKCPCYCYGSYSISLQSFLHNQEIMNTLTFHYHTFEMRTSTCFLRPPVGSKFHCTIWAYRIYINMVNDWTVWKFLLDFYFI